MDNIARVVYKKIDAFMSDFILPLAGPQEIFWWLSMSGGKDSYAMAQGLYRWYVSKGLTFHGKGFFVAQWNRSKSIQAYFDLCSQLPWLEIEYLDAIDDTLSCTLYIEGQQAPCRKCADVRRELGDAFVRAKRESGFLNVIAKGHHLTDLSISLLWRRFFRKNCIKVIDMDNKGAPLTICKGLENIYLAKPLCAFREYETQAFAHSMNFSSATVYCPAAKYPDRRDIVKETLGLLFDGDLWEYDIPEIVYYAKKYQIDPHMSACGREDHRYLLSNEYIEYCNKLFDKKIHMFEINRKCFIEYCCWLENVGVSYLIDSTETSVSNHKSCSLYSESTHAAIAPLVLKRIAATLGPLWGSVGLHEKGAREKAQCINQMVFGVVVDESWSQVNSLICQFYIDEGNI